MGSPVLAAANKLSVMGNNIIVSSAKKIMSGSLYAYQHPLTGPVAPGPAAIALLALLMSVLLLVNLFS
jgi:hypothetical protein